MVHKVEGNATTNNLDVQLERNVTSVYLKNQSNNDVKVIVGVVLAIVVLIGCAIILYCCLKKKTKEPLLRNNQVFFKNPSFGLVMSKFYFKKSAQC